MQLKKKYRIKPRAVRTVGLRDKTEAEQREEKRTEKGRKREKNKNPTGNNSNVGQIHPAPCAEVCLSGKRTHTHTPPECMCVHVSDFIERRVA